MNVEPKENATRLL